jgi:menaquinone-dependent protoporphyrinogen oxidase
MNGWQFPDNLQDVKDDIKPHDTAFFHGALDEEKLGFAEKLIVKALKAPMGDFRDWDRIQSWADRIAEEYHQPA